MMHALSGPASEERAGTVLPGSWWEHNAPFFWESTLGCAASWPEPLLGHGIGGELSDAEWLAQMTTAGSGQSAS